MQKWNERREKKGKHSRRYRTVVARGGEMKSRTMHAVPLSRLNITLYSVDAINSLEKCAIRLHSYVSLNNLSASRAICHGMMTHIRALPCRVASSRTSRDCRSRNNAIMSGFRWLIWKIVQQKKNFCNSLSLFLLLYSYIFCFIASYFQTLFYIFLLFYDFAYWKIQLPFLGFRQSDICVATEFAILNREFSIYY